jgi:phosphoribosylaminoimidazole carboxylase (NCAIR synthetase)
MPRILLFASTTGYQVHSFAEAAERLGFELILATDRCHVLDDPWGDRAVAIQFDNPSDGFAALRAQSPFDGILAVGDQPALVAAQAAERLRLEFSPPDAVRAAHNKFLSRERFAAAGLLTPAYRLIAEAGDSESVRYPCVLKPLGLSGSRGVIRADSAGEFRAAFARIQKLVEQDRSIKGDGSIQVEDFIPGQEFALEGVVTRGELQTLALFDKPDPLDGPYFEEAIYVTPSRATEEVRRAIHETTQRAIRALGLTSGPVHAEMRVNDDGVWMLEIAARPIGGLCSRVLRFDFPQEGADDGRAHYTIAPVAPHSGWVTLEEILLRQAAGESVAEACVAAGGHAVMMIPIPRAGVYVEVEGVDRAREVEHVDEVVITAKAGQTMLPLPEGASYLGFIFAHGPSPEATEKAVREAHARLHFEFSTPLPVVR